MADSTPPTGGSQAPASPPKRGRDSLVWWKYLRTYVLLGIAALLIAGLVWEGIESGKWLWFRERKGVGSRFQGIRRGG